MTGKQIVVIGGGFGGVSAATTARKLLGPEHQVTLIDRTRRTYLCGSFPLLIVGQREAVKVSRSLGSLANRGVTYLQAEVESIDLKNRAVMTSNGTIDYDSLVVAPGASYDWDAVPGSTTAYSFYNLETARRLRSKLSRFTRGRVVIAVSSVPYKCPPAPFEVAMILDWAFKQRQVRNAIEIHVFTPEPAPLAVAGPEASAKLRVDLARRGVELHTEAAVREVDIRGMEATFTDGSSLGADLIVTVPTHRVPPFVEDAGLSGPSGYVTASPDTLETGHDGVFAIGDVTSVLMANGRPLPKAGVFASSEGETVGHNIAAAIQGTEPSAFSGAGHCFIAYSGTSAGMVRGNFLAEGSPDVRFQTASARGYRAKERFERDWRRFRV